MFHLRAATILAVLACLTATLAAQEKKGDAPPLFAASGTVDKADKEGLVVKPRGADGKFQKAQTLKVTGTSKVTLLSPQKRADKVVLTQREIDASELAPGQAIAVIYSEAGKDGLVLLSAVAEPAPKK